MATYNATRKATGVEPVYHEGGCITVVSTFDLANGVPGLNNADVVNICDLPPTAQIVRIDVDMCALDTGATATWEVGDATNGAGAFISGSTVGQSGAGGQQGPNVVGWAGYAAYTATTTLKLTMTAMGTKETTGKINFVVSYTCEFGAL